MLGAQRIMLEGIERQGRAQSRRPLKHQCGELRSRSRNLEKIGPGGTSSKKAGVRCFKASPRSNTRPFPPPQSPPLGSHARRAAKARHRVVPEGVRLGPIPCRAHPRHRRVNPESACRASPLTWLRRREAAGTGSSGFIIIPRQRNRPRYPSNRRHRAM